MPDTGIAMIFEEHPLPPPFDELRAGPEELSPAVDRAGVGAEELERLGAHAFESGAPLQAAALYEAAVRAGAPPRVRVRLAAVKIRLGLLESAVRDAGGARSGSSRGYAHLQHGNALRYLGEWEAAHTSLTAAKGIGEGRAGDGDDGLADGILVIAAECALGELALDEDAPERAVPHFGRALGLTELARNDALTVAPLAGLAEAHARWRAPGKAPGLARRALERAKRVSDRAGAARALLALTVATRDPAHAAAAELEALQAPHVPLWVRIGSLRFSWLGEIMDEASRREAYAVAAWAGMRPEAAALSRKETP